MKKLTLTAITLTAAFALTAANYTPSDIPAGLAESDVTPGEINYQGLLRDPKTGDKYADGIYTLECRLYKQESEGTAIWGASYNAYVKDGYFNLMLGGAGGADLGYTYKATDLWKALWFKTGSRDLYLGVTPRQNASNEALVSPTEILPRQKLLTAPFAFRAQKAQYADGAPGNFKVDGNLEVAGNVNIASGKSLTLNNISSSSSEVKIGTSKSSPSKATLQGSTVTVEAGSALNVNSHGNANITMDTGKKLSVNGGTLATSVKSADLKASYDMTLDAGEVIIKGDTGVDITAQHGIGLNDGNPDGLIVGGGSLYWAGSVSKLRTKPFYVTTISFYVASGKRGARVAIEDYVENSFKPYVKDYKWTIAGFGSAGTINDIYVDQNSQYGSMAPYVNVMLTDTLNAGRSVTVHLLGVNNYWCIDRRD